MPDPYIPKCERGLTIMTYNLKLKQGLEIPNRTRTIEVILHDGTSVYYSPKATPMDVMADELESEGIDLIATLSIFYDPKFIEENRLNIINDGVLWETSFEGLFRNYVLLAYGAKNYWSNDPKVNN
jgi:hypothetical protein